MSQHQFKPVDSKISFPEIEQRVLDYWKKNKTFEKSLEILKDVYGRYYTMKGHYVRRVWGWDGHGLPIENKVENELKLKRKKDIEEKVGVKKFIELCKKYVEDVSGEWEWYVDHIGRWVDFKNAYKTWSP